MAAAFFSCAEPEAVIHLLDLLGCERRPPGRESAGHLGRADQHPSSVEQLDKHIDRRFIRERSALRGRSGPLLASGNLFRGPLDLAAHVQVKPAERLPADTSLAHQSQQRVVHSHPQQSFQLPVGATRLGCLYVPGDGLLESPGP